MVKEGGWRPPELLGSGGMHMEEVAWDLDLLEQAKTRCRCDAMLVLGVRANFSCRTLFIRAAAWEDLVKVITFLQYRDPLSWNATSVGLHKRSHVELQCPLLTVLFMCQPGTAVSPSSPSALLSIPPVPHCCLLGGRCNLKQCLPVQDLGGKAVAIAISHCSILMWRWTLLHMVCLKGTASVSLQIRRKKNLSLFLLKKMWQVVINACVNCWRQLQVKTFQIVVFMKF